MGNTLGGGRRATKVMKITGETMKFKKPTHAGEILINHPGHVLLDSESVKQFGVRAKPLEAEHELKPKRLYFLVELPKPPPPPPLPDKEEEEDRVIRAPRKVRSGIQMSAKDRLDSLMLAKRSASDLSAMKSRNRVLMVDQERVEKSAAQIGVTRLKLRLPKAEVERLMMESRDENEAAEKIMDLCVGNRGDDHHHHQQGVLLQQKSQHCGGHNNQDHGILVKSGLKSREKRVGFLPISEREIQLAMAT